jgi:hypothetical protein
MVLFLAVTMVTYVIFFLVPADPARLAAGQSATPERVKEVEHFLGLDQPIYVQYYNFLKRLVVEGSLGESRCGNADGCGCNRGRDRLWSSPAPPPTPWRPLPSRHPHPTGGHGYRSRRGRRHAGGGPFM